MSWRICRRRRGGSAELAWQIWRTGSWFGARLLSLGTATLAVSVTWPPPTHEHARRVAAEHLAFCHDLAHLVDFGEYAQTLVSAGIWTFWWD
jgi:hypothetical protein